MIHIIQYIYTKTVVVWVLPVNGELADIVIHEVQNSGDLDIELASSDQNDAIFDDIGSIRGVANCENFIANELLNPHRETGVPVLPSIMPSEDELFISSIEKLRKKKDIIMQYPLHENDPLNEYNTPYLASMAFPTLFPYGSGDIFGADPHSNKKSFVQKFRYLLKFCEINDDGTLDYRFAKHSRFVLWLYNLHYRHRTLAQGKIYISQARRLIYLFMILNHI